MEGIYLLAATSRPDLIDSAIIRNVNFFLSNLLIFREELIHISF